MGSLGVQSQQVEALRSFEMRTRPASSHHLFAARIDDDHGAAERDASRELNLEPHRRLEGATTTTTKRVNARGI